MNEGVEEEGWEVGSVPTRYIILLCGPVTAPGSYCFVLIFSMGSFIHWSEFGDFLIWKDKVNNIHPSSTSAASHVDQGSVRLAVDLGI